MLFSLEQDYSSLRCMFYLTFVHMGLHAFTVVRFTVLFVIYNILVKKDVGIKLHI